MTITVAQIERLIVKYGRLVTLRRYDANRTPTDVTTIPAIIQVGGAAVLVGDVQQTGDGVMISDSMLVAAGWTDPPHHGDQVRYEDVNSWGMVQGEADVIPVPDSGGRIFKMRVVGG